MLSPTFGCYIWHSESLTPCPVDITTSVSESPGVDLKIELQQFSNMCQQVREGEVTSKNDIRFGNVEETLCHTEKRGSVEL